MSFLKVILDNSERLEKQNSTLRELVSGDIIEFYDEQGITLPLSQKISDGLVLFSLKRSEVAANLIFCFIKRINEKFLNFEFKKDITNESIDIRQCIIRFETVKTFSQLDFGKYKSEIKKLPISVDDSVPELAHFLCKHCFVLPYDFEIYSIAQEESDGVKVQKFVLTLFFSEEDRSSYLDALDKIKKTDHRYIGKSLEYFMMIPESPGSVFWLPKGWKLYKKLEAFIRKYAYIDYKEVRTPLVMSNDFWKKSGHLLSFKQNIMFVTMGENCCEESALKPMNCPAHIEVFKRKIRSYRDLPLRLAEFGSCHRYEPSGSLHGLMRVRALTQDDGHIFCSLEHVAAETVRFLKTCLSVYEKLGFKDIKVLLATKPENALGDDAEWLLAEKYLADALNEVGIEFSLAKGEGAFYGPKIELHIKDSLERSWQLGTIQLDFILPQRFDLSYVKADGSKGKICMLHRAVLGSLERFIGVLLEHSGGNVPVFLAPIQIAICTVTDLAIPYAKKVYDLLSSYGIDAIVDERSQTLSYKIHEHKAAKVPALIIIGEKEIENQSITLEYLNKKMVLKLDEVSKIMRLFNEM